MGSFPRIYPPVIHFVLRTIGFNLFSPNVSSCALLGHLYLASPSFLPLHTSLLALSPFLFVSSSSCFLSAAMEFMWDVPGPDVYKINVHCEISAAPSPIGNTVAIGSIIRGPAGEKCWGLEGPLNHLSEEQAIMAAIQAACVFAHEKKMELTHIETTNVVIFELISDQDQFIIPPELLESFRLFNSLHANNNSGGANTRQISWIPHHMNSAAVFMAKHGMQNLSDLVKLPDASTMGNLQFFLDRDMGRVLPYPEVEVLPNLGLGEVVDAPPSSNTCKRLCTSSILGQNSSSMLFSNTRKMKSPMLANNMHGLHNSDVSDLWTISAPLPLLLSKGKDKLMRVLLSMRMECSLIRL